MDKLVAWRVVGSNMPVICTAVRSAWARLTRIAECDEYGYAGVKSRTRSSLLHDFVVQALENSPDLEAAHDTINQLDVFRFHCDGRQVGLRFKKTHANGSLAGEHNSQLSAAWRGDAHATHQLDLALIGVVSTHGIPLLSEAQETALLTFGYVVDEGWSGISEVLLICYNGDDVAWTVAIDLSNGICLDPDIADADETAPAPAAERRPRFRTRTADRDEGADGAER